MGIDIEFDDRSILLIAFREGQLFFQTFARSHALQRPPHRSNDFKLIFELANNITMVSVDQVFLLIALISLPNIFFKAEYNLPLFLFAFACWADQYKSTIMYLFIFSWIIDVYYLISFDSKDPKTVETLGKGKLLLISSLIIFILKIIVIGYLIITDMRCRKAASPLGVMQSCLSSIKRE